MGGHSHPLAAPRRESELTSVEKEQLAKLKVGNGEEFSAIILEVMDFYNSPNWKVKTRDKVKSKRGNEPIEIVWEHTQSKYSSKAAAKFTANVKNLTATSMERVIGDDPDLTGAGDKNMYKYDRLLERYVTVVSYANNVFLSVTCHKAPIFAVAPREMHHYHTYANSFNAEQQAKLNVVPRSALGATSEADKRAAEGLRVVCQCSIDFHAFNARNGINEKALPPPPRLHKKSVVGAVHHYLLMAQEELDGSLTITMVTDMDPAGSLPTSLVDMAMSEQLEKMKLIVALCESEASAEPPSWKTYENDRDFATIRTPAYSAQ